MDDDEDEVMPVATFYWLVLGEEQLLNWLTVSKEK
jgi:hypothetical protein